MLPHMGVGADGYGFRFYVLVVSGSPNGQADVDDVDRGFRKLSEN